MYSCFSLCKCSPAFHLLISSVLICLLSIPCPHWWKYFYSRRHLGLNDMFQMVVFGMCWNFVYHCLDELFPIGLFHDLIKIHRIWIWACSICDRMWQQSLNLHLWIAIHIITNWPRYQTSLFHTFLWALWWLVLCRPNIGLGTWTLVAVYLQVHDDRPLLLHFLVKGVPLEEWSLVCCLEYVPLSSFLDSCSLNLDPPRELFFHRWALYWNC